MFMWHLRGESNWEHVPEKLQIKNKIYRMLIYP